MDHTSFDKEICYLKKLLKGTEKELDEILKGKVRNECNKFYLILKRIKLHRRQKLQDSN